MISRRNFGQLALAAVPAARALAQGPGRAAPPPQKSVFGGVRVGVQSYSFRQGIAATDLIPVMNKIGVTEVELMSNNVEALAGAPAAPQGGGGGRGRAQMTPEQIAAMQASQKAARDAMTAWRAGVSMDTFKGIRKQFDDAGINLGILCYNLNGNVTDEEIDYSFRMAQALGVSTMTSSSTVTIAKRVAPFADKYKITWGGHGHDAITDPEQFASPESFAKIMSFSKYIGVNLDIGHFSAAGYDPVAYIKEHHARITNIHLKDRARNSAPEKHDGANVRWGDGTTPIKQVLLLLKQEKYGFPANIEYEYQGTDPVVEVAKCLEYARDILIA